MERTITRDKVREVCREVETYLPYDMPDEFWIAWGKVISYAVQAAWPTELHEQYLTVLDERDTLQEQIDYIKELLNDA